MMSDAARRQPSANAPAFVQHSHRKTLSLQNSCGNQPSQSSPHNDASLFLVLHTPLIHGK
jgi:hypothetical protein